jgi:hypothetical protein
MTSKTFAQEFVLPTALAIVLAVLLWVVHLLDYGGLSTLDSATAEQAAKSLARAEQDKLDSQ